MLQSTHKESLKEASERQANFIALRTLEDKLPQQLFSEIVSQIARQSMFPKRMDWTGEQRDLTYQELKVNYPLVDQGFLSEILESSSGSYPKSGSLNINESKSQNDDQKPHSYAGSSANLLARHKHLSFDYDQGETLRLLGLNQISKFERMKTVFGHAVIDESSYAPIWNVKFDRTNNFIFSAADDGIIKIWDRHTMNLQAALHSHEDVITEIDVSKCNRFLASASNDKKIIIWDWKTCTKLDEIREHTDGINKVRFCIIMPPSEKENFSLGDKGKTAEEIQILVSCSEDGTIKVFDEIGYLDGKNDSDPIRLDQPKRLRARQEQIRKERFTLNLVPEDFRAGARNKKIDSVIVSRYGLVVAGSDKGDIYLWQLNYYEFKKRLPQCFKQLYSFKNHTKNLQCMEFSPNGKFLLTGSVDGTAKVWKLDKGQIEDEKLVVTLEQKRITSKEERALFYTNNEGNIVNLGQQKDKKTTWVCHCVAWSITGRYALAALSGKFEDEKSQEQSLIKVWDSISSEIVHDLARYSGVHLQNYTYVLSPHPKMEEILLSGSDNGTVCLWNLKTKQLIKKFLEYGIYSYEKYTMSNPYDGRFSSDGSCFVIGSDLGTISLFGFDGEQFKYCATRVEQFYQLDESKHPNNIYYEGNALVTPQVCGYHLIPYEVQPPSPLIGPLSLTQEMTSEEYDRNRLIREELSKEEEKFLMNQLAEGLQNDIFNNPNANANEEVDQDEDMVIEAQRRPRRQILDSQQSNNNDEAPQPRQAPRRNAPQAQGVRRVIQVNNNMQLAQRLAINPNFDPDNSLYDRESDENFMEEEEQSASVESESDEEMESEGSSSNESGVRTRRRAPVQVVEESHGRNGRALRSRRRENLRQQEETKRSKKRAILDESDVSAEVYSSDSNADAYGMSDVNEEGPQTRKRLLRNTGSRKPIEDDSDENTLGDDSEYGGRRNKAAAHASSNRHFSKKQKNKSGRRSLRQRENGVNYKDMDESSEFEDESSSQEEEKIAPISSKRRQIVEDSFEDEPRSIKDDDSYVLEISNNQVQLQEEMIAEAQKCSFCQRSDGQIIGPFVNQKAPPAGRQSLYFHQDCLDANNITYYNSSKNKWMNIGQALENIEKRPSMCDRCGNIGATIKCKNCRKTYHGYFCSSLYMLYIDVRQYQCYECRNKENFRTIPDLPLEKAEYKILKKTTKREYLLLEKQPLNFYMPQIGDQVYYFYQGHEKFIASNNCFFYCGDTQELSFRYPWTLDNQLRYPTKCSITAISFRFPSAKSLFLLKKFGKTMEIEQEAQIISRITLRADNESDSEFEVDFFLSELPQFLVQAIVYEESLKVYQSLARQNKLIGQVFKKVGRDGTKYKVVADSNFEGPVNQGTNWNTISIQLEDAYRLRERNRRGARREVEDQAQIERTSFWLLQLDQDEESKSAVPGTQIDLAAKEIAINAIQDAIEKKKDTIAPFMQRVPEAIAKDYRRHVASEMWINLIQNRLINFYYRHLNQVYQDFDQIYINARIYNGEDHQLTQDAKKIIENIKRQIKISTSMGSNGEKSAIETKQNSNEIDTSSTRIRIPLNQIMKDQAHFKPVFQIQSASDHLPQVSNQNGFAFTIENNQDLLEIEQQKLELDQFDRRISKEGGSSHFEESKSTHLKFPQSCLNGSTHYPAAMETIQRLPTENRRQTRRTTTRADQMMPDSNAFPSNKQEMMAKNSDDGLIGKATRSGRITKSLNQNLIDENDEEEYGENGLQQGSKKRLRKQ